MRRAAKAVVCLLLLGLVTMLMGAMPADNRAFVSSRYALELDGASAGWLSGAEGGNAYSDVVTQTLGPDHVVKKHLAGVKYEDITITVGTGMSEGFYKWIADTIAGKAPRHSGAIIAATFDHKEMSRLSFYNALISEVTFPAADASSKDAAKMTIKIRPERTRQTFSAGGPVNIPAAASTQKKWLPANFRLRIDGLESATQRVNKIEAITIKQKVAEHSFGDMRDYEQEPVSVEIPNLVITLPESHADDILKWEEDFLIRGRNGDDQEKSGSLEFLTPDLKEVLFRLDFRGLGIFKLTPDKAEAGGEQLRRVKAEMYCEDIRFQFEPAAMLKAAPTLQQAEPAPAPADDPAPKHRQPKQEPTAAVRTRILD